ncbi:MAG: DUF1611 domain-containing protein [Planctomycetes bacterium]|nr:DUF1611 domain-containing protein [Planctomycetota bacterium]MBI3834850.1 DUF1611 domain-containing protein [Planctomycetota bacterium]
MSENGSDRRRIKWGYCTHVVPNLPVDFGCVKGRLLVTDEAPRRNDVIVAEVLEIGRHTKIELPSKNASTLFPGDLVGMAYGYRYATRQFEGTLPAKNETCHILGIGGVCGQVIGMATDMLPPTTLSPLGYVDNSKGGRLNLRDYCPSVRTKPFEGATIVLVVGSSMDSGKTTAAYSVVHGLTKSGARVAAGKITGTASVKDPLIMDDAGAIKVLDFTDVGHASTAMCEREELEEIVSTLGSALAEPHPDYIVLEIADGIVQRETMMLLEVFRQKRLVDYVVYTCNDSLGVAMGVTRLRAHDLNLVAVSGWVGCSPLAAQEAQAHTDLPVLRPEELRDPAVVNLFGGSWTGASATPGRNVILPFPAAVPPSGMVINE